MKEAQKTVRRPTSRLPSSFFHRTVEDSPLGISVSRGEQILYVNKAWRRLMGVPLGKKVVGLSHMAFVAPEDKKRVSRITSARQAGERSPSAYDSWAVRPDGTRVLLRVSVTPVELDDGRAELVFLEDVTERRKGVERLRWLSHIAEQVGEGVAVADLEGELLFVNDAWAAMHGGRREDFIGQHLSVSHTPEQIVRDVLPFNEQVYQKGIHTGEVGHIRLDGTPFAAEMTTTLLKDERDKIIGLIAFAKDITERKRAEEALRDSEERFRKIFDDGPLGMAVVGPDLRLDVTNEAFRRMMGFERDELAQRTVRDITHPDHLPADLEAVRRLEAGEIQLYKTEKRYIRKDGSLLWGSLTLAVSRDSEGAFQNIFAMIEDVTDRKRAEETLRESEERFRSLAETTAAGILIFRGSQLLYANSAWLNSRGFTLEEARRMKLPDFIHPDHKEAVRRAHEAVSRGTPPLVRYEVRILTKDGRERWMDSQVGAIAYQGEPAVLVTALDITDRKAREVELAESEHRFRTLAETTSAAIMIFQGFRLRYVNPAWEKLMGYTREEASQREVWEFVHPDHREVVEKLVLGRLKGEKTHSCIEIKVVAKNGREMWGDFTGGLIQFEGRPAGLVTAFDITDRKRAEEALKEREKLYRVILDNVEEIVWSVDLREDPVKAPTNFISGQVESIIGYSPAEIMENPELWFDEIVHPEDRERVRALTQASIESREPKVREYRMRHKTTGEDRWVEDHIVPVLNELGRVDRIQGVARDVTERLRARAELERSNRELTALVNSAQAMTGFLNLEEAAQAICEAAVDAFDMRMVWIGLVVPEGTELKVLASAGHDEGYTRNVRVRWDESSRAQGPTGRAIKERKPVVMRPEEPDFAPWRDEAIRRGYGATCAIPLIHEETVRGAINFYSRDPGVFAPKVIEILEVFARQATMVVLNASLYGEAARTIEELNAALMELQRSQAALKESEERYRGLVENAKGIMLLWTPDLKITYWNDFAEQFFGFQREEILGRSLIGTIVPHWESSGRDLEILLKRVAADPDAYASNINQNVTKEGKRVWIAWTNRPILDAQGHLVVVLSHGTDITPLKEAEIALRESEERYRALVETSPEAIALCDVDGNITMVNKRVLAMWKSDDPGEIVGQNVRDFITPEDRSRVPEAIKLILGGGPSQRLEYGLLRRDGSSFPAELHVSVLADSGGRPRGMIGVVRDLSREKEAAELLSRSEHMYRTLAESAQDYIFIVGRDGLVRFVNPYAAASLGRRREDVVGQPVRALFPPANYSHMSESLREVFETGRVVDKRTTISFRGQERILDTRLIPMHDPDGIVGAVMGLSRDVTDRG